MIPHVGAISKMAAFKVDPEDSACKGAPKTADRSAAISIEDHRAFRRKGSLMFDPTVTEAHKKYGK